MGYLSILELGQASSSFLDRNHDLGEGTPPASG
jgi:hypothetical protein